MHRRQTIEMGKYILPNFPSHLPYLPPTNASSPCDSVQSMQLLAASYQLLNNIVVLLYCAQDANQEALQLGIECAWQSALKWNAGSTCSGSQGCGRNAPLLLGQYLLRQRTNPKLPGIASYGACSLLSNDTVRIMMNHGESKLLKLKIPSFTTNSKTAPETTHTWINLLTATLRSSYIDPPRACLALQGPMQVVALIL